MSAARPAAGAPVCRFCAAPLRHVLVDLGMSPLCESYVTAEGLERMEPFYPLVARVCESCLLVQVGDQVAPQDIFGDYAYFSSYSDSWVEHARRYAELMIARLGLSGSSRVVEIASNDGYMLRHFRARGIPVLGVEPAGNVAAVAVADGIDTHVAFFGRETARELAGRGVRADLVIANNVLAHVPDLNDFTAGLTAILAPGGVVTLEFPHVARLVEGGQFDTIYHEHFSYFSFFTARRVLARHGLAVFDVEEISTHGGSLRLYATRPGDLTGLGGMRSSVTLLAEREAADGFDRLEGYEGFDARCRLVKRRLLEFLIRAADEGRSVVGYGAPGKGNTLLNYCGIRSDLLAYTVDRSPHKQGLFLPGTHIPIHHPDRIAETRPDHVLILPWNLREEIVGQLAYIREWGGSFVVPIPEVELIP